MYLAAIILISAVLPTAAIVEICHAMYRIADNNLDYWESRDLSSVARNENLMNDDYYQLVAYIDRHSGGNYYQWYNGEFYQMGYSFLSMEQMEARETLGMGPWGAMGSWVNQIIGREPRKASGLRVYVKANGTLVPILGEGYQEPNSDDPSMLYAFLKLAFDTCIENKKEGTDLKFVVTLHSHGAAFEGFGGDNDKGYGRRVTMKNEGVEDHEGVDGIELLGFDACQMMTFSTVAEYQHVCKYFLASELDEPVVSWEMGEVVWPGDVETRTVLDFANGIVDNYIHSEEFPMYDWEPFLLFLEKLGNPVSSTVAGLAMLINAILNSLGISAADKGMMTKSNSSSNAGVLIEVDVGVARRGDRTVDDLIQNQDFGR